MPSTNALSAVELAAVRAHAALLDDSTALDAPGSLYSKVLSSVTSTTETLDVWSRAHSAEGVKQYLCIGTAPVTIADFVAVVHDDEYRTEWDSSCAEMRMLRAYAPVNDPAEPAPVLRSLHYWAVRYPSPLRKRDYVYERVMQTARDDQNRMMHYVATAAALSPEMPPDAKNIRVTTSKSEYCVREVVRSDGLPCCKFVYVLVDDPGGMIPKPIVNFLTNKTLPSAMAALYAACKNRKKDKM
jgi:START domain